MSIWTLLQPCVLRASKYFDLITSTCKSISSSLGHLSRFLLNPLVGINITNYIREPIGRLATSCFFASFLKWLSVASGNTLLLQTSERMCTRTRSWRRALSPRGCFTKVSLALENNLAKIHNARNHIYGENFWLKLCMWAQRIALGSCTNFSLKFSSKVRFP